LLYLLDSYSANILIDGRLIIIGLWDTRGGEDYARLRPLSYPETDVFLLAYGTENRASFENIESYWLPEFKQFCPDARRLLVACKSDLQTVEGSVAIEEGRLLADKLKLDDFIECSAKDMYNVNEVFKRAAMVTDTIKKVVKEKSDCSLM
jgi:Ras-related C3 botulinum toxin substrate 1